MKNLRKFILGLALVVLAPSFALAQPSTGSASFLKGLFEAITADPAANFLGADNKDIAFVIKYVGTAQASGTVQVSTTAVLLKVGAGGAETADATVTGCGATAGTLTYASCASVTLGGLIDRINASPNWKAVILDGFRGDALITSSLLVTAATSGVVQGGLNIPWTTATQLTSTVALIPERNIEAFIKAGPKNAVGFSPADPYINHRILALYFQTLSTFGSGTSNFQIYAVRVINGIPGGGVGNEPNAPPGGPQEIFLPCNCTTPTPFYQTPGGATTVQKTYDFTPFGVIGPRDAKLVVRLTNSAAMSSTTFNAYAVSLRYN